MSDYRKELNERTARMCQVILDSFEGAVRPHRHLWHEYEYAKPDPDGTKGTSGIFGTQNSHGKPRGGFDSEMRRLRSLIQGFLDGTLGWSSSQIYARIKGSCEYDAETLNELTEIGLAFEDGAWVSAYVAPDVEEDDPDMIEVPEELTDVEKAIKETEISFLRAISDLINEGKMYQYSLFDMMEYYEKHKGDEYVW